MARIAGELAEAGFVVRTLSGEMEQPERDRALAAFRQGGVQALVATDVAARGIDVRDIARVIQVEPPTDVETYTHRSGRTGRAGKQGTSVLFVAPSHYPAIARGLARAKIAHRVEPIPRPEAIQRAREEKLVAWLAREGDGETIDPHAISIAERIVKSGALADRAGAARREGGPARADEGARGAGRSRRRATKPRSRGRRADDGGAEPSPPGGAQAWVTFRVTWGGLHGADARRLLAVACRRGNIRGSDVGAIRVEAALLAHRHRARRGRGVRGAGGPPDPRNPRVRIMRADERERAEESRGAPPVPARSAAPPVVREPPYEAHSRPDPRPTHPRATPPVQHRPAPVEIDERPPRPRPRVEERPIRPYAPHRAGKPERPRPAGPRSVEPDRRQRRGGDAPVRRSRKG